MGQRTRLFTDARHKAVHLPEDFRVNTRDVYITRDGDTGDLVISAGAEDEWDGFILFDENGDRPFAPVLRRDHPEVDDGAFRWFGD